MKPFRLFQIVLALLLVTSAIGWTAPASRRDSAPYAIHVVVDASAPAGAMQKVITATSVPGEGQITAIGDGTGGQPVGTGALFFDVQSADTAALGSTRVYEYDVKIKLDDGTPATLEIGTFRQLQGVTTATT